MVLKKQSCCLKFVAFLRVKLKLYRVFMTYTQVFGEKKTSFLINTFLSNSVVLCFIFSFSPFLFLPLFSTVTDKESLILRVFFPFRQNCFVASFVFFSLGFGPPAGLTEADKGSLIIRVLLLRTRRLPCCLVSACSFIIVTRHPSRFLTFLFESRKHIHNVYLCLFCFSLARFFSWREADLLVRSEKRLARRLAGVELELERESEREKERER